MKKLMERLRTVLRRLRGKQKAETAKPPADEPQKTRRWWGRLRRH
jgi:hypothetical protein